MKILFLANLSDKISGIHSISNIDAEMNCSSEGLSYPLNLLKELSNYAEVEVYSPPILHKIKYTPFQSKIPWIAPQSTIMSIPVTVDAQPIIAESNPDIAIQYVESIFPYLKNFEKAKCKRAIWFLSNPAQAITDPKLHSFISPSNVDLLIKSVDKTNELLMSQQIMDIGVTVKWLPFSVNSQRFRNKNLPRTFDVSIMGNMNPYNYFLRVEIYNYTVQKKLKYYVLPSYGESYVNSINQTKLFCTCSGRFRYPIMKYFEVPCCGTPLMADEAIDLEPLGFRPNREYISLDEAWHPIVTNPKYPNIREEWIFDANKFSEILEYYLNNQEREQIAKNGQELVLQKHTDKIRAKELYQVLQS